MKALQQKAQGPVNVFSASVLFIFLFLYFILQLPFLLKIKLGLLEMFVVALLVMMGNLHGD